MTLRRALVGLLGSSALVAGLVGNADAGLLTITNKSAENGDYNGNHFRVLHYGDGSLDSALPEINPPQDVDFYSFPDSIKLLRDARRAESTSTVRTYLEGNNVSGLQTHLGFKIDEISEENKFAGKPMFLDLYDASGDLIGNYDVRKLASGEDTSFPTLSVNDGVSYTMDIRFTGTIPEPSTGLLALAGIAGLGVAGLGRGRRSAGRQQTARSTDG